jgi:ElaB/YqjD/DUF883 family membrane-anchored ribosome-binding protein
MADNSSAQRDPEEIRREIERKRADMSKTVTALEARLNPQTLKQQATDTIRENTVGRVEDFADNAGRTVKGTGADVFDTIKKNPLPAALAAVGLGWLFMESRNQSSRPNRRYAGGRYSDRYPGGYSAGYRGPRYADEYGDEYDYRYGTRYQQGEPNWQGQSGRPPMQRVREATGSMQDKAGDVAGNVQDKASQVVSNVQDTAGQVASNVQDTAGQVVSNVQDTAGQVASQAQQQAYRVKSRFEDLLDQNPLVIGLAAAALGAALGFSIPPTPQENQLMGSARDNLMDKMQDKAQDTAQKVQQVAQKTTEVAKDTAKDEAQKQNLTSSSS